MVVEIVNLEVILWFNDEWLYFEEGGGLIKGNWILELEWEGILEII